MYFISNKSTKKYNLGMLFNDKLKSESKKWKRTNELTMNSKM